MDGERAGRLSGRHSNMIDFDSDLGVTTSVLDAMSVRAKVIMNNIANQNTPGYKSYRVRFEELLREAHASGKPLGEIRAQVVRDTSGRPGVNNVSAISEIALMDKVRLIHDVFSYRAGGYFRHMNRAIFGR